jgi:hypothetical protein
MLTVGLPAVLDDLDDAGTLRASAPSGQPTELPKVTGSTDGDQPTAG